ncbi:10431_t:CDS:2, partial [Ambispora gerdemannii]
MLFGLTNGSVTFQQLMNTIFRKKVGLKVQLDKYHFEKTSLPFLSYIIGKDKIKSDLSKVEKVQNYSVPENITTLRGFIGLASYYQRFIKDFAKIALPLHKLFHKNQPYIWNENCQKVFDTLKKYLTTSPILIYFDFDKSFILFTDASSIGLGAILSQKDPKDREKIIIYASRR